MSKTNSGLRTARDNNMNMSASILRQIVASTLKIDARGVKLSGILPTNFLVSECNSSGNLYSCSQTIKVWSFTTKDGLKEVRGSGGYATQNANGSWNDEYGVSFKDCSAHKAIFFVVRDTESGWQQGSESWDRDSVTVYKAPNFKEHYDKLEVEDIKRWEKWITE